MLLLNPLQSPKNPLVRSSLLGKLGQGKWIILLCLTARRVQNGRRTSKNSEILWTLHYAILILTHQQLTAFQNIVGKGEIARNEQFLLFLQCFLLNQIIVSPFVHIFDIISFFAAEFEEPKTGISGKGLNEAMFRLCCNA